MRKRVTIQLIANSRFVTLLGGFVGASDGADFHSTAHGQEQAAALSAPTALEGW